MCILHPYLSASPSLMELSLASRTILAASLLICAGSLRAQTVPVRGAVEELRIDGIEADLSRIVHLAVDSHGRIVVAQPDDGYLLVFDSSGSLIGHFGRSGSGPGEFQSIVTARGWVADTFWQADGRSRRVSFWRLPDSLLRDEQLLHAGSDRPAAPPGVGRLIGPHVVSVLPGGAVIVRGSFLRAEGDRGWATQIRDSAAVVLLRKDGDGPPDAIVATWPPVSAGCLYLFRGAPRVELECLKWVWGIAPDGSRIAYAAIGVDDPRPKAVHVVVVSPTGATIFARQVPVRLFELTPSDVDSIRTEVMGRAARDGRRLDEDAVRTPGFFRPITRLVVGRDETTWLKVRVSRSEYRWLVLGPCGASLKWVSLPQNFRLEVAERGRVWGTERDADGIQSVLRYRID